MCLNIYCPALMRELLFIFLQICSFIHQILFSCLLYARHYTESEGCMSEQIVKHFYTNKIINETLVINHISKLYNILDGDEVSGEKNMT